MEKSTSKILQSFAHSTVAQPEKFSHGWTEIIVFTLRGGEERKRSMANGIELSEADCRGRAKGFEERTRVSGGD